MNTPRTFRRAGFTLVELLVVIGIIVVLMALVLGATKGTTDAQRKTAALNTSKQIVAAVNAYYTDYARYPTVESPGSPPASATEDTIVGDQAMGAAISNNALFHTLRDIPKGPNQNFRQNPRRTVYFTATSTKPSTTGPRNGFFDRTIDGGTPPEKDDGALFDPWGGRFGVIFDTSGDERINLDGYYSDFTGDDPSTGKAPRDRVGAFSMGKDGKLGKDGDRTFRQGTVRSDDVVSWE